MKKIMLVLALTTLFTNFVSAQDSNYIGKLECKNTKPEIGKVHFIDIKKGGKGLINLEVNWGGEKGGSTFAPANLKITNGTIQSWKPVGQIGAKNPKQTWVIKVIDLSKPVLITWQTKGTTDMCGTQTAQIGTRDFQ